MIYNQHEFDIKLEWGIRGVEELQSVSDVIVIVDILSFSTCVDIATKNGAIIYPYRWKDETAIAYAKSLEAELADYTREYTGGYSLSPTSMTRIKSGTRLVLPSPNGSTLTLSSKFTPTLCGSLRNAKAVAEFALSFGKRVSVIPAGEHWTNNTLRPAFEDLLGAGAIISYLTGNLSPESNAALAVYNNSKANLLDEIKKCSSGKELIARGLENDVYLACELNASDNIPLFTKGSYVGQRSTTTNF
jgi:2-phosphosulfolactate phosphatase